MAGLGGLWDQLVDCICRPPRDIYGLHELIGGENGAFSVGKYRARRMDMVLVNPRGAQLQCSHFVPMGVEGVDGRLPCVVYLHCNSGSRRDAEEALCVLIPLGVSVFTLDLEGSGMSDGKYVTLGAREVDDLETAVDYLREHGKVSTLGLWGRSMGAVTALLYGQRNPCIAGMVLDSPFSKLTDLMLEIVADQKLPIPKPVMRMAISAMRKSVRKRADFDFCQVSPIDHAPASFIPALFGHAKDDTFVRIHHSEALYKEYAGDKNFIKFEGDHNDRRSDFFYNSVACFFHTTLQLDRMLVGGNPLEGELRRLYCGKQEKRSHSSGNSPTAAASAVKSKGRHAELKEGRSMLQASSSVPEGLGVRRARDSRSGDGSSDSCESTTTTTATTATAATATSSVHQQQQQGAARRRSRDARPPSPPTLSPGGAPAAPAAAAAVYGAAGGAGPSSKPPVPSRFGPSATPTPSPQGAPAPTFAPSSTSPAAAAAGAGADAAGAPQFPGAPLPTPTADGQPPLPPQPPPEDSAASLCPPQPQPSPSTATAAPGAQPPVFQPPPEMDAAKMQSVYFTPPGSFAVRPSFSGKGGLPPQPPRAPPPHAIAGGQNWPAQPPVANSGTGPPFDHLASKLAGLAGTPDQDTPNGGAPHTSQAGPSTSSSLAQPPPIPTSTPQQQPPQPPTKPSTSANPPPPIIPPSPTGFGPPSSNLPSAHPPSTGPSTSRYPPSLSPTGLTPSGASPADPSTQTPPSLLHQNSIESAPFGALPSGAAPRKASPLEAAVIAQQLQQQQARMGVPGSAFDAATAMAVKRQQQQQQAGGKWLLPRLGEQSTSPAGAGGPTTGSQHAYNMSALLWSDSEPTPRQLSNTATTARRPPAKWQAGSSSGQIGCDSSFSLRQRLASSIGTGGARTKEEEDAQLAEAIKLSLLEFEQSGNFSDVPLSSPPSRLTSPLSPSPHPPERQHKEKDKDMFMSPKDMKDFMSSLKPPPWLLPGSKPPQKSPPPRRSPRTSVPGWYVRDDLAAEPAYQDDLTAQEAAAAAAAAEASRLEAAEQERRRKREEAEEQEMMNQAIALSLTTPQPSV